MPTKQFTSHHINKGSNGTFHSDAIEESFCFSVHFLEINFFQHEEYFDNLKNHFPLVQVSWMLKDHI